MAQETIEQFCPCCGETTNWAVTHTFSDYYGKVIHIMVCPKCGYTVSESNWASLLDDCEDDFNDE